MTSCLTCGAETGQDRFCVRCGAQTAQFPAHGGAPPPPTAGAVSMVKDGGPPPGSWPPPPPPVWPPLEPTPDRGRRRVAVIALGIAVLLVTAGATGYVLLRPGPTAASVTDPVTSAANAGPTDSTRSADGGSATTRSSAAGGPVPGGSAPAGPTVSSVRSTPTSIGTTPFVPVPTGATADCSAPDGVDAANVTQSYEPAKAFDGRTETAWRCSGDAAGKTLVITFAAPVQLTSVGLIPGYDKIDPTDTSDRFVQSRKVLRVRWTFDDGTTVESNPNGQRGMHTNPVSVRTGTVRMTIEQTMPGSTIINNKGESLAPLDTTAVSEIAFAAVQ